MSGFFNYPWRPSESLLFLRSLVYHVTSHYSSTIIVCIPPSDQVIFFFVGLSIRPFFLGVKSWKERKKSLHAIECFHMTSRRPHCCPKPIHWELNSFLMQTLSFVPINLHRCWPREWKRSSGPVLISESADRIRERCKWWSFLWLRIRLVLRIWKLCYNEKSACTMYIVKVAY